MKQALHCGRSSTPTLNQTGELKLIFWWTSRCVSSALKVARSSSVREVVLRAGAQPAIVLTTRSISCLTLRSRLGRPDVAAEVLADHDVGGELAPEAGNLDVRLLEDGLARLVLDLGGAQLPGDLVVGVDAGRGPAALEGQAAGTGPVKRPSSSMGPTTGFRAVFRASTLVPSSRVVLVALVVARGIFTLSLLSTFPSSRALARRARNHLMLGFGRPAVKAKTTTCGAPTTTRPQLLVFEAGADKSSWAIGGSLVERLGKPCGRSWVGRERASQGSHMQRVMRPSAAISGAHHRSRHDRD